MRVLHIITTLGTGGAEKLLLDTIPLYNEKGIEADVLVLCGGGEPFYNRLKELNCCQIFSLKFHSYYNPGIIFKIIPWLKKYDLVHTHLFSPQYFTALAKFLSGSRTPLLFTEHNTSNRRIEKRIYKLPEKFIYSKYYNIICITEEVKQVLKNHINIKDEKIRVIENGVNLVNIQSAKELDRKSLSNAINKDDYLIIQVAGFREQKDQETLIKALKLLPYYVKLLLVGDGETLKSCKDLVNQLNLSSRVIFLGLRTDVPALLKTADIVVLSSKYEGLSLSSIEGMASGRPFVASNVPGLSDVVGGAGVLFPQGDEKVLAKEITNLINDKEYYNEVVRKCQIRASKYEINRMVDQTIDLYKEIVNNKY